MSKKLHTSGYSLVEMVIYIALLSVIFVVVINTLFSFTGTYRNLAVQRMLDHSSIDAMERITRDIRSASSVDIGNSVLGTSPGTLSLIAISGSNSTTTKFYVQNGIVKVDVNGTYAGPLTLTTASTTALTFTFMASPISSAVKIDMTVTATSGPVVKSKSYHSTVILHGE